MSFTRLDFKEIKNNYNYTTNELMLHYGILSGELPNELIDNILNPYTKSNIFTRKGSKVSDCFKYKKKDGVAGYQLLKQGKHYFLNKVVEKKKSKICTDEVMLSYICDGNGQVRKNTTNDVGRRKTYQKLCKFYYMLDVLGISYLPSYRVDTAKTFYTGRELNKEFAKLSNSTIDHRLRGTKIKGVLNFNDKYYNVFLYDNDIIGLFHKEELRIANDIRIHFENKVGKNVKMGTIVMCKNTYMQEKVIKHIIDSVKYPVRTTYITNDNYNYFRDYNNPAGINIISFDEIGEKQLYMLSEQKTINNQLRKQFCKPINQDEDGYIRCQGIICDGNYNDMPCFFLYTLDYNKIETMLNNIKQTKVSIICLKEHIKIIDNILKPYSDNYTLLPIEFNA